MKYTRAITYLCALLMLAPVAHAEEPKAMDVHGQPDAGTIHAPAVMPMDMDMNAEIKKHMQHMQANTLRMHDLMHKIAVAKTAKERDKLTQEHLDLMSESMDMMVPMMMHMMMSGEEEDGEEEDVSDAPMPNPAAP